MRRIVAAVTVSCASVGAQTQTKPTDVFQKAPPQIDGALRDRIAKFYDAHVAGKFRAAEEFVSPASRDLFYESDHQRYISYEIVKIDYSENFTKALVVTAVEIDWRTARLGVIRVKPPLTSTWRFEDGQWYWYTIPRKDWDTPWGTMNPGPDGPRKVMSEAFKGITPESVQARVRPNKGIVSLSSYQKSHDEIQITNGLPGEVKLRFDTVHMPGLAVRLDKETLKEGEIAKLIFDYDPPARNAKATAFADVHVAPTGQTLSLQVQFAVPPEVEEQLKKRRN